jgi:hypothetical protein
VQPAPTADTPEVSETEKTLLRSDGTFESSRDLMKRVEASQQAKATPGDPAALGRLEPEGGRDAQEPPLKPNKTFLYADSTSAPLPQGEANAPAKDEGGTVVTPVSAIAAPPTPAAEPREPARDLEQAPPGVQRRPPPSAVPTEQHPLLTAAPEPARRSPKRRPPKKAPAAARARPDASSDAAVGLSDASPETAPDARRHRPRPRHRSATSRYQWLWILLVLLTAGGGWGAYQAGLLDGLLGRSRSGGTTTVTDASRDPSKTAEPTPADTAARTSAAAAGSASTGTDDTGTDESGSGQAAAATTTATPPTDAGTDEPTSTTGAPAASTGEPEPVAAASTGTPDEPAAGSTGGPDEPTTAGEEEPQLSPEEALLATATAERRVFMLKTLFTTRRQGSAPTWNGGWARCAKLEVDGVKGWRLPHRREMKLLNAVLSLPSGTYWTRTVPDDDKQSAYALDTSDGSLSLFPKQEPTGEVVCVRGRELPEK